VTPTAVTDQCGGTTNSIFAGINGGDGSAGQGGTPQASVDGGGGGGGLFGGGSGASGVIDRNPSDAFLSWPGASGGGGGSSGAVGSVTNFEQVPGAGNDGSINLGNGEAIISYADPSAPTTTTTTATPTTTTTVAAAAAGTSSSTGGTGTAATGATPALAVTGENLSALVLAGALLMIGGAAVVAVSTSRRRTRTA
jgi:hypothetical protein